MTLKVSPRKAIVDDALTVSFRVQKRLPAGWHYEASVLTPGGFECASFVHQETKRRPGKGKVLSFTLSPYDDVLNSSSEFCQGKGHVSISEVPNPAPKPPAPVTDDPFDALLAEADALLTEAESDDPSRLIAIKTIRFYAKP